MGKLIDFNTKKEIIVKSLTIEDFFIKDLIFLLGQQVTEKTLKETLLNKYQITLKTT